MRSVYTESAHSHTAPRHSLPTLGLLRCSINALSSAIQDMFGDMGTLVPSYRLTFLVGDNVQEMIPPEASANGLSINLADSYKTLTKANEDQIRRPGDTPTGRVLRIVAKVDRSTGDSARIPHSRPDAKVLSPLVGFWVRQHCGRFAHVEQGVGETSNHLGKRGQHRDL